MYRGRGTSPGHDLYELYKRKRPDRGRAEES